jgi:hypothetical protein
MIRIRDKDVLLILINFIGFTELLVYYIFNIFATAAIVASGEVAPMQQSGLVVLYSFGVVLVALIGFFVIIADLWWLLVELKDWKKQYRRDNL